MLTFIINGKVIIIYIYESIYKFYIERSNIVFKSLFLNGVIEKLMMIARTPMNKPIANHSKRSSINFKKNMIAKSTTNIIAIVNSVFRFKGDFLNNTQTSIYLRIFTIKSPINKDKHKPYILSFENKYAHNKNTSR